MGTFVSRVKELRQRVGDGKLEGKLNVDQIYAYCQHEHLWWKTRHKYLTKALSEYDYFGKIAAVLYSGGGRSAMITAVEELNTRMARNAPKDTGRLSRSGSPEVRDNGAMVYHRPPAAARMPGENKGIRPHRKAGGA